jgi:hypothetical protein
MASGKSHRPPRWEGASDAAIASASGVGDVGRATGVIENIALSRQVAYNFLFDDRGRLWRGGYAHRRTTSRKCLEPSLDRSAQGMASGAWIRGKDSFQRARG